MVSQERTKNKTFGSKAVLCNGFVGDPSMNH